MCFWAFDGDIALGYIGLNIAVRLNLLLCASHHLTQLSDRFVRVLVTLVGQLALMSNVHILFSRGLCMLGIRSGVGTVNPTLTDSSSEKCKTYDNKTSINSFSEWTLYCCKSHSSDLIYCVLGVIYQCRRWPLNERDGLKFCSYESFFF